MIERGLNAGRIVPRLVDPRRGLHRAKRTGSP